MSDENFPLGTIADRASALAANPSGLPSRWTPEHVVNRIVEAMQTMRFAPDRIGPRGGGGAYPPALIAAAKARDAWLRRHLSSEALADLSEPVSYPKDEEDDEGDRLPRYARDLPTSADLSRMAEAIAWPMMFLGEAPIQSDALMLFCMGKAFRSFEINPILSDRRKAASIMAWATALSRDDATAQALIAKGITTTSPGFSDRPAEVRLIVLAHVRRRQIAKDVAAEINRRLAGRPNEFEKIRAWGRDRYFRLCREGQAAPEGVDDLQSAMPGRCLHRWQVDRHRQRAAFAIAESLEHSGIEIR